MTYRPEKFSGGYGEIANLLGISKAKSISDAVTDFNPSGGKGASSSEAKAAVKKAITLIESEKKKISDAVIITENPAGQ